MIITATLHDVAAKCDEHFNSLKPLDIRDCRSVFEFLKTELSDDIFRLFPSFDVLMGGFRKTIGVTINKAAFIDSERNAINSLLGSGLAAWYKQTPVNHYKAYDEIRSLILIGKDEFEVFKHHYLKYLNKDGSSYKLVSVIFCFGLIKYQLFLEGDPLKDEQQLKSVEQPITNREQPEPNSRPVFNPDEVESIFGMMRNFFTSDQQEQFKELLLTGNDSNVPLLFLDSGNRLADAFRRLHSSDKIIGVNKTDLIAWTKKNFTYQYRGKIKEFTSHYLESIISANSAVCKSPILIVSKDKATGMYSIEKA